MGRGRSFGRQKSSRSVEHIFMKLSSERASTKVQKGIIPSALIASAGRAIFGAHWQAPLAKTLRIQDQTMRRWTNDGCPTAIVGQLRLVLKERAEEIARV